MALPANAGFYLVSPELRADTPKLVAFRDWLINRYKKNCRRSARRDPVTLQIDDDVIVLDRDLQRLGDVGPLHDAGAGLDVHRVGLHPEAFGIAVGLPGADVEFPAVPRAAHDFAGLVYSISPGSDDCASPISGPSHSAAP